MSRHGRFSSAVVVALAMAVAVPAAAQETTPVERALAQTLFDEGRTLMTEKRYAEACAKFAKSQQLDPSAGTFINLALCHESEGKLATAWAEFNEALSQALRDGRADREQSAREHIDKLKPRLNQLTVKISELAKIEGFKVTLDGANLREPLWGISMPIDPGKHMIEATAPNRQTYATSVTFDEPGQARTVELPPLQKASAPAAPGKRGGCASCDAAGAQTTSLDPSLLVVVLAALSRKRKVVA